LPGDLGFREGLPHEETSGQEILEGVGIQEFVAIEVACLTVAPATGMPLNWVV